jgi:hypothetical protein
MRPASCQIRSKMLAISFRRSAGEGSVCQKHTKSDRRASAGRVVAAEPPGFGADHVEDVRADPLVRLEVV